MGWKGRGNKKPYSSNSFGWNITNASNKGWNWKQTETNKEDVKVSSVEEQKQSSRKRNNSDSLNNTDNHQEEATSLSSKKSKKDDSTSSAPPLKEIMVQKGNDKTYPYKVSDIIPLKKQYEILDKIFIYNDLSDQVKNYSISKNLPLYRIENAIAYTIVQMKKDKLLYKKFVLHISDNVSMEHICTMKPVMTQKILILCYWKKKLNTNV